MQPSSITLRAFKGPEVRFLVAGGIAAFVNWLVRFPIEMVAPFFAALIMSTGIGMTCGFLLYRAWVFTGHTRPLGAQIRDFVLVNLTGQATMLAVAALIRQSLVAIEVKTMIAGATAHAIGIAVGAVVNYLGHRHITFPSGGTPQD